MNNFVQSMSIQTSNQSNNDPTQPINISFSRNNSIYQNPRLRRESIAHSQGMGGISWGSVGIGSWLRDEVFIHNQQQQQLNHSNQAMPLPRHQSINLFNGNFNNNNAMDLRNDSIMMSDSPIPNSSYLADLEANYCKDYSCCGQLLPTLHDLLKHYEEMHITGDNLTNPIENANGTSNNMSSMNNSSLNLNMNNNSAAVSSNNASNVPSAIQKLHNQASSGAVSTNEVFLNNHLNNKQNFQNNNKKFNLNINNNKYNNINNKISNFNLNLTYDHPQMNNSSLNNNELHNTLSNFNFNSNFMDNNDSPSNSMFQQNNNNPHHQQQHQQQYQNQTEQQQQQQNNQQQLSNNYQLPQLPQQMNQQRYNNNQPLSGKSFKIKQQRNNMMGMDIDMDHDTQFQMDVEEDKIDMDDLQGNHNLKNSSNGNMIDDDDDDEMRANNEEGEENEEDEDGGICIDNPARRLYMMEHKEERPFQCPVIGCDKTYKNQNGLKYHRIHGHQNQKLRDNGDGTFSVINPDSDSPYPNGMGFEKDKPYRCEVCAKRYKNLNGLKYHRAHTTH